MVTRPQPILGAAARAAAQAQIDTPAKRKLALLVGGCIDAGYCDPSVEELAERTGLTGSKVVRTLDALERDGVLRITRGNDRVYPGTRSTYVLTVPGAPAPPQKESTMSTKTAAPPSPPLIPADLGEREPWAVATDDDETWLAPLKATPFQPYEDLRIRHREAVERFEAVKGTAEEPAAVVAVCEAALEVRDALRDREFIDAFRVAQQLLADEINAQAPTRPLAGHELLHPSHPFHAQDTLHRAKFQDTWRGLKSDRSFVEWASGSGLTMCVLAPVILEQAQALVNAEG